MQRAKLYALALLLNLTTVLAAGCLNSPSAGPAPGPVGEAHISRAVEPPRVSAGSTATEETPKTVEEREVCFLAHDHAGESPDAPPLAFWLKGTRLTLQDSETNGAIILVGGGGNEQWIWNWPGSSTAHEFALARYTVFVYDRLGIGKSRPAVDTHGGLHHDHASMLAEVTTAVQTGSYRLAAGNDCRAGTPSMSAPAGKPLVIGNSLGGYIAAEFVGRFGGAAGIVQGDMSHVGVARPDLVAEVFAHTLATITPQGYTTFPANESDCRRFVFYLPGTNHSLEERCRRIAPAGTPAGEAAALASGLLAPPLRFPAIAGPLPVLLTFANQSTVTGTPDIREDEQSLWESLCEACDVVSWVQPEAGHDFMLHHSARAWTKQVLEWIDSEQVFE